MSKITNTQKDKVSSKKAKGPIRFEAIIPICLILVAIWLYGALFLDSHARRALEFLASRANGAQVDVGKFHFSFTDPSLLIEGIEITDRSNPRQNVVAIEKIRFSLVWDALLRAKLLISESSLTGLALDSPRTSPGKVFPKPSPEKTNAEISLTDKIRTEVSAQVDASIKNNFLGDIASVLSGTKPTDQIGQIREQLESETRIKALQVSLAAKSSQWTQLLKELPNPEAAKEILDKVKATKIDISNPALAKNQLESLKTEVTKLDELVKSFQKKQKILEDDIAGFNADMRAIDEATKKDLQMLQTRLKIPSIDRDNITRSLLSKLLGDKLLKVTAFIDQAKEYIPERSHKSDAKKPDFVPHPRGSGRTYKFPVTRGYPLVWLKTAEISSKSTENGFTGDFTGKILNLTSDPQMINVPTSVELSGSAPKQELRDISIKIVLDYRGEQGHANMDLLVGSHPFPEQTFASGGEVDFSLLASQASLSAQASFTGSELKAKIDEVIQNPQFKTDARSPLVREALKTATSKIKQLDMKITLEGNFSHQKIGVDSNLGTELASGLQQHLKLKLDQARDQLKSFLDGRIGGERARLTSEYNKIQNSLTSLLKAKDGDFKTLQAEVQKTLKEKSGLSSDKSKKDMEQKAKELLKKIKL